MNRFTLSWGMLSLCFLTGVAPVAAQPKGFNYDESKVAKYTLAEPLKLSSGAVVKTPEEWFEKRRPAIYKFFEEQVYGRVPARPEGLHFEVHSQRTGALEGKAIQKQVTVYFSKGRSGPKMDLLLYVPQGTTAPVPAFLGLNFNGNHSVRKDSKISLSRSWVRNDEKRGNVNHRASEKSRGSAASRWSVERIVERGYALATIYYGDIDPDFDDGFQNGVHALYHGEGRAKPGPADWGSLATWGWGLSRALDYLETDQHVDATRVALLGHSRLGKTALWAGARDDRFALVISNNSGCGGAALSKRRFGETVKRINTSFPHWFCDNFNRYNDNEAALPMDQHLLVALIAPRPVYVASASRDLWADPHGEFLSVKHASPVYELLGRKGISGAMPPLDQPIHSGVAYHIRTGKHDVTDYDWQQYLDFADRHLKRR